MTKNNWRETIFKTRVMRVYSNEQSFHGGMDWDGNPVERTPSTHPYSYDPYVVYKIAEKYSQGIYSDRILGWDYEKHNELCQKHFGDEAQYWDNREPEKVQDFLRDFFDDTTIRLVGIMKGCNVSNGYPYWIFMINNEEQLKR